MLQTKANEIPKLNYAAAKEAKITLQERELLTIWGSSAHSPLGSLGTSMMLTGLILRTLVLYFGPEPS
jgi:hypothetical protein